MKTLIVQGRQIIGIGMSPDSGIVAPAGCELKVVDDTVIAQIGWVFDDLGIPMPPPEPPPPIVVGPNTFKYLFKSAELASCYKLAAEDPVGEVAAFMRMVDDIRTLEVMLSLPATQARIQRVLEIMAEKGLIEASDISIRLQEILSLTLQA